MWSHECCSSCYCINLVLLPQTGLKIFYIVSVAILKSFNYMQHVPGINLHVVYSCITYRNGGNQKERGYGGRMEVLVIINNSPWTWALLSRLSLMMELELTDDGVEVGGVKCSDNVSIFTLFHLNLEIVIKTIWLASKSERTNPSQSQFPGPPSAYDDQQSSVSKIVSDKVIRALVCWWHFNPFRGKQGFFFVRKRSLLSFSHWPSNSG